MTFKADNVRITDVLTRHQLFVEGFKEYEAEKFRKLLPGLAKDLALELSRVEYQNLADMNKRKLEQLVRNLQKINDKFFDFWLTQARKSLQDFTKENLKLTKAIIANLILDNDQGNLIEDEEEINAILRRNKVDSKEDRNIPFLWIFDNEARKIQDQNWESILPSNGVTEAAFMASVGASVTRKLSAKVKMAYVSDETPQSVIDAINREILVTAERDAATALKTTIQNETALVEEGVQSIVINKYMWVSIIDDRTSDICRGRNGNIYVYGKGPIPPAHPRCRSKIHPISTGAMDKRTYQEWLRQQPEAVKRRIFSKNGSILPLQPKDLNSKLKDILTR